MDEKIEEVIAQYELEVKAKKRIRGAFLLETSDGEFVLKSSREKEKRILFMEEVKNRLIAQGYDKVDVAIPNKSNTYLTRDGAGSMYIVKRWHGGKECFLQESEHVCRMVKHLACLHEWMRYPELASESIDFENEIKENALPTLFSRHTKEMKRVYNYIRSKKRRNEMEICILNSFANFYMQAEEAQKLIEEAEYDKLLETSKVQGRVVHGSYNYHNILLLKEQVVTTNFDKAEIGLQILDLYDFLRKVMEKNGWNFELGMEILKTYCDQRELEDAEKTVLYVLLSYPEKYWKLINFYYNGKKSWMSAKNFDKLQKICFQEKERQEFLSGMKKLLF